MVPSTARLNQQKNVKPQLFPTGSRTRELQHVVCSHNHRLDNKPNLKFTTACVVGGHSVTGHLVDGLSVSHSRNPAAVRSGWIPCPAVYPVWLGILSGRLSRPFHRYVRHLHLPFDMPPTKDQYHSATEVQVSVRRQRRPPPPPPPPPPGTEIWVMNEVSDPVSSRPPCSVHPRGEQSSIRSPTHLEIWVTIEVSDLIPVPTHPPTHSPTLHLTPNIPEFSQFILRLFTLSYRPKQKQTKHTQTQRLQIMISQWRKKT